MRNIICAIVAVLTLTGGVINRTPANATVLYESAVLGTTGHDTGFALDFGHYLASRFSLTNVAEVTHVGGHIGNFRDEALFAAIVLLDPDTGLPAFHPSLIQSLALAGTFFTPEGLSNEITIPLAVQLAPGDYGLVFGTGAFGSPATGSGFFPCIGSCGTSNPASFVDTDLPDASYFRGGAGSPFEDGGFNNTRFFVLGDLVPVPEPSTIIIFTLGLTLVVLVRRRRGKVC